MAVKPTTRITSLADITTISKKRSKRRVRSRHGCTSCKKLKIKCDEKRPSCEYCIDTNRHCTYVTSPPPSPPSSSSSSSSSSTVLTPIDGNRPDTSKETEERSLEVISTASPFVRITINNSLVNTINYLHANSHEIGLLDFFTKNCLFLFTFGLESEDSKNATWPSLIPQLFFESSIVRNSICSFSSLNLFSIIGDGYDLNRVEYTSAVKRFGKSTKYNTSLIHNHQVFIKTCSYFTQAITQTNSQIAKLNRNGKQTIFIDPPNLAKELVISNILIFTFLAIHPHNLIPLVDFDNHGPRQDFLSICNGIKSTIIYCLPTLIENNFKILLGFFNDMENKLQVPPLNDTTFPLVATFKHELDQSVRQQQLPKHEYVMLVQMLSMLHIAMHKCVHFNYPNPIFRWILTTANPLFHQLIYNKNIMALRLVNLFCHLCLMIRFQLFNDSNMWIDYIEWFKSFNFSQFNHSWKYQLDERLYTLSIVGKFGFKMANYAPLATLNPNQEQHY